MYVLGGVAFAGLSIPLFAQVVARKSRVFGGSDEGLFWGFSGCFRDGNVSGG